MFNAFSLPCFGANNFLKVNSLAQGHVVDAKPSAYCY